MGPRGFDRPVAATVEARAWRAGLAALRPLLLAGAMLLAAPEAGAQTLREALAMAYSNNPTLQAARARLRATDENVPQALSGWRPTVTVQGQFGYADGTATGALQNNGSRIVSNTERNPLSGSATVSQPLYRGGRTVAATRRAESQVLAERANLLATEQIVLLESINAYASVIRDQEVLRLTQNNVRVLERQLQAARDRFRVGEITRTDVAQAEARLERARSERATADGTLQISRAVFQRLIGEAPRSLVPPPPIRPVANSSAQAATLAESNNPNVLRARFDEQAAIHNVDLIFGELLPTASLQGSTFRNDDSSLRDTRSTGSQVLGVLSVPLYQGGQEHARVRQAKQEAQRAREAFDEVRRQVTENARRAWETLESARAEVAARSAQIRANEIALDGVQREALVGSRTTLDVLNAEQELLDARVALVRATAQYLVATYGLASSAGRLTARDLSLPVQIYDPLDYYKAVRDRWVGTDVPPASTMPLSSR
ncbi:TolC family outer membrane protein [Elioraea rosea]|uniref:TolC family outer membrane protein n=1 Tax=Elioraea rosea TaxID=2492390 RepID=UPI001EF576C9|nr:TolC family outer membrane protein [Elioraea rosea]